MQLISSEAGHKLLFTSHSAACRQVKAAQQPSLYLYLCLQANRQVIFCPVEGKSKSH